MAYNLKLAERIRAELGGLPFVEKKMFGGVGFLIDGNTPALPGTCARGNCAPGASVACGVYKDDMIVRLDPEKQDRLLKKPGARVFDITGKPMQGWLMIEQEGCKTKKQLSTWVKEGVAFASTLPAK
jgi:hypothetical protein